MGGALNLTTSGLSQVYSEFVAILPLWAQKFINLFFISLLIVIYAIFIWKFYRWVARKDILELDLRGKYSSERRFTGSMLYILEYLIILPIIVSIWFVGFTLFLLLLTENIPVATLLVISTTIITAIRMTAYYKEDLSKDLAKLLPFTLLGVAVTQFGSFSFGNALNQIKLIPQFFQSILIYLAFIIIIEFTLRLLEVLFVTTGLHEEVDEALNK